MPTLAPSERSLRGDRVHRRVDLRERRSSARRCDRGGRRIGPHLGRPEHHREGAGDADQTPRRGEGGDRAAMALSRPRRVGWEALVGWLLLRGVHTHMSPPTPRRPIEMLVANDPETLDPRYATDAVGLRTTRLVHAGLVRLDPDTLAPLPTWRRGWRWLDPLTLEVELRDDVRFHSGAPFRARDVVATLQAFASPAVASRHASVVDAIARRGTKASTGWSCGWRVRTPRS